MAMNRLMIGIMGMVRARERSVDDSEIRVRMPTIKGVAWLACPSKWSLSAPPSPRYDEQACVRLHPRNRVCRLS